MKKERKKRGISTSKRSQITIFVILAILIVGILIFLFYPSIQKWINPTIGDMLPNNCIEKAVKPSLALAMSQGGTIKPELYFMYNNDTIDYLCYTSQWYRTCTMQIPLLKQHIENEVQKDSQQKITGCIEDSISRLESKGYTVVTDGSKTATIILKPDNIVVSFNFSMKLIRDEVTTPIDTNSLETKIKSKAYDIIMIASSIQNFEARYGDTNTETYMGFYPNIKVEKLTQSDGSKIYIITERNTKETLIFAVRSLAWPPGIAVE